MTVLVPSSCLPQEFSPVQIHFDGTAPNCISQTNMIHPATTLRLINPEVGYGVFATEFIPMGTITYVKDPLETDVPPALFHHYTPEMQAVIEKYSYRDERGHRILSWDFGKYVNHCCHCNTMSTGYGFEIAIRDIWPGEEITDEYGLFNMEGEMNLLCSKPGCRLSVSAADAERMRDEWDAMVKAALLKFKFVEQPLLSLVAPSTMEEVHDFLADENQYKSVGALQYGDSHFEIGRIKNGLTKVES